jgi:hypothetical protein
MPDDFSLIVPGEQHALLRDALADAVFYRDPPLNCDPSLVDTQVGRPAARAGASH